MHYSETSIEIIDAVRALYNNNQARRGDIRHYSSFYSVDYRTASHRPAVILSRCRSTFVGSGNVGCLHIDGACSACGNAWNYPKSTAYVQTLDV